MRSRRCRGGRHDSGGFWLTLPGRWAGLGGACVVVSGVAVVRIGDLRIGTLRIGTLRTGILRIGTLRIGNVRIGIRCSGIAIRPSRGDRLVE